MNDLADGHRRNLIAGSRARVFAYRLGRLSWPAPQLFRDLSQAGRGSPLAIARLLGRLFEVVRGATRVQAHA